MNWAGGNSPHWSPWGCPGTFGKSNKSPGLDLQVFVDGLYRQVPGPCQNGLDAMVSQFKDDAFLLMNELPCDGLLVELLCGPGFQLGKIKQLCILKENDHQQMLPGQGLEVGQLPVQGVQGLEIGIEQQ